MHASNEHSFIVRVSFGIYSLKAGWPGRLRLRASNEGFLKPRVARAREAGLATPRTSTRLESEGT